MGDQPEFVALLQRARGGDDVARGNLFDMYRQRLRVVAQRELGQRIRARVDDSDIVQQTVLSAIRSFNEFVGDDEIAFLAWVEKIHARNLQDCIRHHVEAERRSVGREADVEAGNLGNDNRHAHPQPLAEQQAIHNELLLQLQHALTSLPVEQQEAVRLRHLEGKTLDEVAQQLVRSKVAVASLIARGLKSLRARLEDSRSEHNR